MKAFYACLVFAFASLASNAQKQEQSEAYGNFGFQLENGKYFGAKLNIGIPLLNQKHMRTWGFGVGAELIRIDAKESEAQTAVPIYFNIRKYINFSIGSVYVDILGGNYGYKYSFSNATLSADGRGQGVYGANAGFIIPLKGKRYTGIVLSGGFRTIDYRTSVTSLGHLANSSVKETYSNIGLAVSF